MTNRDTDTRACTLVDLPLIRRISEHATVLDTELAYTRDLYGPSGTMLSSVLLPQRQLFTLVARADKDQVVGQFRIKPQNENVAQMVYIAPGIAAHYDDTAWLRVLDALAREAGRQRASVLIGEVAEDDDLFETMRHSGFAVYARQRIWRRPPAGDYVCLEPPVHLSMVTEDDTAAIQGLIARVVPNLLHPVIVPTAIQPGWIYRREGRILAYVSVSEGRHGLYLVPFIDDDAILQAPAILDNLIQNLPRADKLPVYVRVRRYHEWLSTSLEALQFEPGPPQALMVRHIKAMVRQAKFQLARTALKVLPSLVTMDDVPPAGIGRIDRPPYIRN